MRPIERPGSAAPPKVQVGDVLPCTIVQHMGGRRFSVVSKRAPKGWEVVLESKNPREIEEGDHTDYWITRVDPKRREILVRDGTHGRLPISEAMRNRYLLAVRVLVEPETLGFEQQLEALSEAKGMISRIVKQDSADWLSVYQLLGRPRVGSVMKTLDELGELRERLRAEETLDQDLLERATRPFHEGLERALEALTYADRSGELDDETDSDDGE